MATPQKVAFGKRETDVQERTKITGKDAFIGATILGSAILVTVGIKKMLKPTVSELKKLEQELNKRGFKIAHSLEDAKSINGLKIAKEMDKEIEAIEKRTERGAKIARRKNTGETFKAFKGKEPLKRADVMAEREAVKPQIANILSGLQKKSTVN